MTPTEIIIELNNLTYQGRIKSDPERLRAAARGAVQILGKAVERSLVEISGTTTGENGKPRTVKQPCCPRCLEPILNAEQRQINFCPSCGQAIER